MSISTAIAGLKGINFLNIGQITKQELQGLISLSRALKASPQKYNQLLAGKSVSMIFHKPSTRTRVSSEVGVFKLGGQSCFLPSGLMHSKEPVRDYSEVISRYSDLIIARVNEHKSVLDLAEWASVPVINALSADYHPLQTLADLMTLEERFGEGALEGRTLAWIGDGNNVLHDLMLGSAKLGMNVNVATPPGYEPDAGVVAQAREINPNITLGNDPNAAVSGSDVVVTDTWVSMGQDEEADARLKAFAGYQIDAEMMGRAKDDAVFLHCLPRYPDEVTDEVVYSDASLVFDEAENRMWTVMATMVALSGTWKE